MLPGIGIEPADFVDHGFVEIAQEHGAPVDAVAAGPDLDLYFDKSIVADIHRLIVAPALAAGHVRVWFLGISLGGMGALLYAHAYPAIVEGVILLAPFLGTPGTVAEIIRAGGLPSWEPGEIPPNDGERELLRWLKEHTAAPPRQPALHLGYARDDRFVQGHAMLAAQLPAQHVHIVDGGHDWDAWTRLWQQIRRADPFAMRAT
jgi:pimeloyl-ACP methyl ester carboxylesterase